MSSIMAVSQAGCHLTLAPQVKERGRCATVLYALIIMDLLGVALMILGLSQQFHLRGVLPDPLNGPYAGVTMVIVGILLTMPFFIWSIKASFDPFNKTSE